MSENLIRRFVLTFSAIFIYLTLSGQKNFLPGYIVPLKGDTIHGFVDYRKLEKSSGAVFFRKTSDGQIQKYRANDIKAFGIHGGLYESAIIKTVKGSSETGNSPNLEFESDTVFLESIVQGSRCLSFYQNNSGRDQFYIKNDSTYELLVYSKYYKVIENQSIIVENKKYIGQLSLYLNDCVAINSKINKTEYKEESLRKLFLSYFEFTGSDLKFQKITKKLSVETGVIAGLSSTAVKLSGTFPSPILITDYNTSLSFAGGLSLNIVIPKFQGRWSVYNELFYTSFKMSGLLEYYPSDKYSINYSEIGFSYLKLNNMVRFKFPAGGLFVFLNAGISNGWASENANYLRIERTYFSTHTVKEVKAIESPRKHEQGYIMGLGTRYKNFSLEARNERGNGFSDYISLSTKTNRYILLLGYIF